MDDKKPCYQLLITTSISETKKYTLNKYLQWRQCLKLKILPFWKFPSFSVDKWLLLWFFCSFLWLMDYLSEPCMIGCFNCPITGVQLQPTVQLQMYRMISEKWSCECTNNNICGICKSNNYFCIYAPHVISQISQSRPKNWTTDMDTFRALLLFVFTEFSLLIFSFRSRKLVTLLFGILRSFRVFVLAKCCR